VAGIMSVRFLVIRFRRERPVYFFLGFSSRVVGSILNML
jgi:hypothetical protein